VLIETDPRFTNYRVWASSDTLLAQLNADPQTTTKRLGEPPRLSWRLVGVSQDDAAWSHIENARIAHPPCKLPAMRCASRHIATRCATTSDSGDASVHGTVSSAR
jgi:hypothetical protein